MKKTINLLVVLFMFAFCQGQKQQLSLNLVKGDIYYQKMSTNSSILQSANGMEMNINMTIDSKMSYKVLDIQNSVYDIEVKYESLSMKMSMPNMNMEYSSEKNDASDIVSTLLSAMKNKPFIVKMTKTGKVNEVKNLETLFSTIFEKTPQLTDIQKQQIQNQIMQAYGEKAFKGNLEMCSAIFNESAVSKGDKWIINTNLESGMSATMTTTYELKEIGDSYCIINGNSTIQTANKDAYVESNGMPMKLDLTGTMSSDIKINKKTGWVIESKTNQTIKGAAEIKDSPNMPGGMKMPITMTNVMTITDK